MEADAVTEATITGYVVYYQEGSSVDIATANSLPSQATTGASVSGLKADTEYTFVVLASNSAGLSSTGNAIQASTKSRYYLFGDGGSSLDLDQNWELATNGINNTISSEEIAAGGADNTDNYLKLTGTEAETWAIGGWGEKPGQSHSIDFSAYETFVFWARQPTNVTAGKIAALIFYLDFLIVIMEC